MWKAQEAGERSEQQKLNRFQHESKMQPYTDGPECRAPGWQAGGPGAREDWDPAGVRAKAGCLFPYVGLRTAWATMPEPYVSL